MSIFRTFTRHIASNSFRLSALLLAVTCTLLTAFGSAQAVKHTLSSSGAYATIAETAVKQASASDNQNLSDTEKATLQQPEVQAAAQQAFSPAFVQSSTEEFIDGTYHWLDGKTASPDFKIDLSSAVKVFEDKAADAAVSRAKALPACTLQQLREINPTTINPSNLPCLPPGFNVDTQKQAFIDSITSKNEFLQNPVVTADQIPKDSNGQTVFERAHAAPTVFHWVTIAPWILGAVLIISGVGVIFLSLGRRKGIGSLAISLIGNGLLLLLLSFLSGFVFNHFFNSSSSPLHITDGSAQQSVVSIIGAFNHVIGKSLLTFGGIYTVVGIITLAALRLTRPKDPDSSPLAERRMAVRSDNTPSIQ